MNDARRVKASAPIWGALLLGAGAWTVHLVSGHFLVESFCSQVAAAGTGSDPVLLRTALLILTSILAVIALVATLYAATRGRSLQWRGPGLEREAGLTAVVTGLGAFFVLLIVVEAVPLLIIGCGRG